MGVHRGILTACDQALVPTRTQHGHGHVEQHVTVHVQHEHCVVGGGARAVSLRVSPPQCAHAREPERAGHAVKRGRRRLRRPEIVAMQAQHGDGQYSPTMMRDGTTLCAQERIRLGPAGARGRATRYASAAA